jgi:hypothetical protein
LLPLFFAPYLTTHSRAFMWLGLLSLFPQHFRLFTMQDGFFNKLPWSRKSYPLGKNACNKKV